MQVRNIFIPIRKCAGALRSVFKRAPENRVADVSVCEKAMDSQGRAIVEMAKNQIAPERTEFPSTKSMIEYSKGKIVPPLNEEKPYEYTVVANIKENRVLAEYKGDDHKCSLENLEHMLTDDQNVVLFHGHPNSYPISSTDVRTLLNYNVGQVIAIDKNGQYSMVAKRVDVPSAKLKSAEYNAFDKDCIDNMDTYFDLHCSDAVLKNLTHHTLKKNADSLGIRYLTNYDYLKR